jgi:hypothetical protein
MTLVISSYLLYAPEGFGLPYPIAIGTGIVLAAGAAILFFGRINKKKANHEK